ncbi:PREDICTED: uncharacterized protein LOC109171147 isoform X2 [Ipomoea nil]|uniref:uncharacterized protein LOC109171147 isoform X2 n=1 Tax=Ipomoea nil TaxID=35883 RepID=UPI0009013A50|nr:PREDICTED: uncharacterized protein LOC109171147 isoform X2 [Ipomoea nil]
MPGTIQVSVLEFKELSSSSPPSSVSLKVSMGKTVYQTWDKGDFTFPLTTFRDDLVVMLQDDEGNEISHTGVKTTLIVEKGSWDDIFHLEGWGYVHMKLQFILSEDERNRIRNVRESAMRKKQDRIRGIPETATAVGDFKRGLSDRTEGTSSSPMRHEDEEPRYKHDRSSPAEKLETQSTPSTALVGPISEQNAQSKLGVLEINEKKDDNKSSNPEGQVSGKTSSSVRKMISAFETSLSQERRPLVKTQASKSQPNIVGMGGSLKDPLVSKTWQETQTSTEKSGESSRSALNPVGIKPSYSYRESTATTISSKGNSSMKNSLSIRESGTVSGRTNKDHSGIQTDSVAEKKGRELGSDISRAIDFQRAASNEKLKSLASESSGAWIFPDNMRHLCITTAGKEVLNFLEDSSTEVNVHQSKTRISLQGKQDSLQGTDPTMKGSEKLHKPYEGSEKHGSSGPFGQVLKIAAIIGFGIFVLLNRQKETRTSEARSKDRNFATAPDYVDRLTPSEEQWRTLMEKED